MKKILVLLLLLVSTASAQVPEPVILYMEPIHGEGTERIHTRTTSMFDGFIIRMTTASQTGSFKNLCSGADNKVVLSKYNNDGYTIAWQKCYKADPDSNFGFLFPLQNGSIVLGGATGLSTQPTGRDFLIRKEDASGNILWGSKRYGGSAGEHFRDMISTQDGGYLAVCESNSNDGDVGLHYGSQFTFDIWVIKVDSNGDKVWSTVLGGSQDERPTCVVPIPDGGCYVLAYTLSNDYDCTTNHGNSDVFVARLDSNGNKLWVRCYGGSEWDGSRLRATSVWGVPDGKGGVLIAASTNSTNGDVTSLIGKGDFWLFNLDSSGSIIWDRCFGGATTDEFPQTVCKSTDGSIWVAGVSTNKDGQVAYNYGGDDGWLVHVDSVGNFLSAKVLGGPNVDEISLLQPLDDGLILAGGTYRAAGGTVPDTFAGGVTDVFLTRLAPWTTSVQKINIVNDRLVAYPNPAKDFVAFEYTLQHKSGSIVLYITNTTGQKVKEIILDSLSGKTEWETQDIPSGVYIYELKDGNTSIDIDRIVITK